MIVVYKTRCAGPYHVKNGIPCQDAYSTAESADGYYIMAVADGVGSCKKSDIASQIAADSAVEICKSKLLKEMTDDEVQEVIKEAFLVADANVSKTAEDDNGSYDDYDTTLCLAVYDGVHLFYGQSGDSGLVALTETGEYLQVTSQQRDNNKYVFPLCFGIDYWEFGKVDEPVSAFVLVTDGIWEQIFPKLLEKEDVKMNVSLLERMLNYFEIEENEIPELERRMQEYWENCPDYLVDDDKTSVGVINTQRPPERKEESYYQEPNWTELIEKAEKEREKTKKKLYAHLIGIEKEVKEESADSFGGIDKTKNVIEDVEHSTQKTKGDCVIGGDTRFSNPLVSENITSKIDQAKGFREVAKIENKEKSTKKSNALPTKIDVKI